jgi:hypothetical protein
MMLHIKIIVILDVILYSLVDWYLFIKLHGLTYWKTIIPINNFVIKSKNL